MAYQISGNVSLPSDGSNITGYIQVEQESAVYTLFLDRNGNYSATLPHPGGYQVMFIPQNGPFYIVEPPARSGEAVTTANLNFRVLNDPSLFQLIGKVFQNGTDVGVGNVTLNISPALNGVSRVTTSNGGNGQLPRGWFSLTYRLGSLRPGQEVEITPVSVPQGMVLVPQSQRFTVGGARVSEVQFSLNNLNNTNPPFEVFNNTNTDWVGNFAYSPSFQIPRDLMLHRIAAYHWNNGSGKVPGSLGIQDRHGRRIWWPAVASPSTTNGAPTDWNAVIPGGVILRRSDGPFLVLDSDVFSWSQNLRSGGFGFAKVSMKEL